MNPAATAEAITDATIVGLILVGSVITSEKSFATFMVLIMVKFDLSTPNSFAKSSSVNPFLSFIFVRTSMCTSLIGEESTTIILGVVAGLGLGLPVGVPVGLGFGLGIGLGFGLGIGLGFGLGIGLGFGLGIGLGFGHPSGVQNVKTFIAARR